MDQRQAELNAAKQKLNTAAARLPDRTHESGCHDATAELEIEHSRYDGMMLFELFDKYSNTIHENRTRIQPRHGLVQQGGE